MKIHEGVVFSNRCRRKTLLDRMLELAVSLGIDLPAYYVLDAYYGALKMISGVLEGNAHLITRMRSNAVAWLEPEASEQPSRGRKRKYGRKVKLASIFNENDGWTETECLMYGVMSKVRVKARTLLEERYCSSSPYWKTEKRLCF